jgi:hypothetical protein
MAKQKNGLLEAAIETGVHVTEAMTDAVAGAMKAATAHITPTERRSRAPKNRASGTTPRSKAAPRAQRKTSSAKRKSTAARRQRSTAAAKKGSSAPHRSRAKGQTAAGGTR